MFANKYYTASIMKMSPILRGEVANYTSKSWVNSIPLFRHVPRRERREFITELCISMTMSVYVPGDSLVTAGELNKIMFVITKGMVVRSRAGGLPDFLSKGAALGEDIVMRTVTDKPVQRKFTVTCLNYVDVMQCSWKQLLQILTNGTFPTAYTHQISLSTVRPSVSHVQLFHSPI